MREFWCSEDTTASENSALAQEMSSDFGTRFSTQDAILKDLQQSVTPLVAAGPNQQGFNAPTLANLQTTNLNANAAAYRNAAMAVGGKEAGNASATGLTSGIDKQINAGLASQAAASTAAGQNQIQAANYATGRQNYQAGLSVLGGVSSQENPEAFGSGANSALGQTFGEQNTINQLNNQATADIAGMITGGVGDFTTGTEGGGGLKGGLTALLGG